MSAQQKADSGCIDHLDFAGSVCEDCGLEVDKYGNTEDQFSYCSFPDCGCDGSRLCMAERGASERAIDDNVEGMWSLKTKEQRAAVGRLMDSVHKEKAHG